MDFEETDVYSLEYDRSEISSEDFVSNLMLLTDKEIVERVKKLTIPENYKYKNLVKNILKVYKKYGKLSEKQKQALCITICKIR